LIEHYESSALSAHWKKMVMVDGEYRKIWFYHHRNEDGLIYREEQIGSRTFERFKEREDRLIYRSVKFTDKPKDTGGNMGQTFVLSENLHLKRSVTIEKMTQKYALSPDKDAERQIAKCEFNLKDGEVNVYYHYRDGKITCNKTSYLTEDLLEHNKGDVNEKEVESDKAQNYREIYDRQNLCHTSITDADKQARDEEDWRQQNITYIQSYFQQLPTRNPKDSEDKFKEQEDATWAEVFTQILERSIYVKAREKMNKAKDKSNQ
jgi:hypothetical protein